MALESICWQRFGQGEILVGVNADGVYACAGSRIHRAVTGLATAAEDDVRTLIDHGVGRVGTPGRDR